MGVNQMISISGHYNQYKLTEIHLAWKQIIYIPVYIGIPLREYIINTIYIIISLYLYTHISKPKFKNLD